MANLRSLVIDGLLGPTVMPGLKMITGSVTMDSGQVATITFPAKSVICAFGVIGATAMAGVTTISNGVASVAFTTAAGGDLQYFITGSISEEITITDAGTGAITIVPQA